MKQAISVFFALVILTVGAYAQNPGQRRGGDNGWRERVRSEKVAFLTEEIDLTESEAQVFWPIYNQIQKEQRDNFEAVRKAYEAMAKGVQDGKSGKEMEKLVKAYIDAQEQNSGFETKYLNKLMKALFRHQQIGRLGNGNFPNFRMSEEQQRQWRERGEQLREQWRGLTGQKKEE